MARKKEEVPEVDIEVAEEVTAKVVSEPVLEAPQRLVKDLGREDLNEMRDAVNELFRR